MKHAVLVASVVVACAAGVLAGCEGMAREDSATAEGDITPLDRLIVGPAASYPADPTLRAALPELRASQTARRERAWAVARKVLEPVAIDATGSSSVKTVPRFQTWYAKDEVLPMFDRMLRAQTNEQRAAHEPPSAEAIAEAFAWEAGRARTLPGWSEERLATRRGELDDAGTASIGGNERVLMSPSLVGHLYAHYDKVLDCIDRVPEAQAAPPSATNFAPCVGVEFPEDAVVVKARWVPETLPLEAYDTSSAGLTQTLTAGEWASVRTAAPDERGIYTMRLSSGIKMRLAALHIATKELRDWMWISLFWSDAPNTDFGADRPADFAGPLANYKMCTVVAYDEEDEGAVPGERSLDAAHAATRAFGPRTWCSNPYLEHGKGNATTNCIGCHQHGGTPLTSETILEGPTAFADGARAKSRENFPADYVFVTSSGLELGSLMKMKVDQLSAR